MKISMIAALSENNVIGINGQLPWRLKKDLAHFRALTLGKTVLMGRKTFESIGRPLPNRKNIILTRDLEFKSGGVEVVHDLAEALALIKTSDQEMMIIGGEQIYRLFLPYANQLYLTRVKINLPHGDAFFPEVDLSEWTCLEQEAWPQDAENEYECDYEKWWR